MKRWWQTGRLFQDFDPTHENERSPNLRRVRCRSYRWLLAERRHRREVTLQLMRWRNFEDKTALALCELDAWTDIVWSLNTICCSTGNGHKCCVNSVRSFVRYCGQGSSLLWTPALRPFMSVQCASQGRGGELVGVCGVCANCVGWRKGYR